MKNQGITLVALVVTIVIMLILAGVTLNLAIGDRGLFKMAENVVNAYEQAAKNEALDMEELEKQLGELWSDTPTTPPTPTPEETKPDRSKLNIGDKVNYTPDENKNGYPLEDKFSGYNSNDNWSKDENSADNIQTIPQENYTWKIMNKKEDGTVEIMGVPTDGMRNVYFRGPTGYNNGVYLLNNICSKLYGNNSLGAEARSINIDDIIGHYNMEAGRKDVEDYIAGHVDTSISFSGENVYYPKLAKYDYHVNVDNTTMGSLKDSEDGTALGKDKIKIPLEEDDLSDFTNSMDLSNTFFMGTDSCHYLNNASYFTGDGESFRALIYDTGSWYWLATRSHVPRDGCNLRDSIYLPYIRWRYVPIRS